MNQDTEGPEPRDDSATGVGRWMKRHLKAIHGPREEWDEEVDRQFCRDSGVIMFFLADFDLST